MTADTIDHRFQATPGQVAAIERDGFLVVAGPRTEATSGPQYEAALALAAPGATMTMTAPVPTSKPCPECGGNGEVTKSTGNCWPGFSLWTCPTCNGDGTVPIVVEVVEPERECPDCGGYGGRWHTDIETIVHGPADGEVGEFTIRMDSQNTVTVVGHADDEGHGYLFCDRCKTKGTIPARTLLRGTAEAVPVVDGKSLGLVVGQHPLGWSVWTRRVLDGAQLERDVTHHFADVPRPEVGDTAWIIRGEGS